MSECRPSNIPLPEGTVLVSEMSTPSVDVAYYLRLVGNLIYLTNTRPDISYLVGVVSRFMASLQQSHLDAVMHILRYVCHMTHFGLLYGHTPTPHLASFIRSSGP